MADVELYKKTATLTVRLPVQLFNTFKYICLREEVSVSKLLRQFIINYVNCNMFVDVSRLGYFSLETNAFRATVFIRLQRKLFDEFKDKCTRENMTMSDFVRLCMLDVVDRNSIL